MSRFSLEAVSGRPSQRDELFADLRVVGLQRLSREGRCALEAPRSYTRPLLLWVTRGQGRIAIGDRVSGYGTNNLIFLPAGAVHGIDVPAAVLGQAVFLPETRDPAFPEEPLQIRARDGALIAEITGLLEIVKAMSAPSDDESPRAATHLAGLVSVFLSRQRQARAALPAFSSRRGAAE